MKRSRSEADIDETLAQSFPASDPPSWTAGEEPAAFATGVEVLGLDVEHGRPASKTLAAVPAITVTARPA